MIGDSEIEVGTHYIGDVDLQLRHNQCGSLGVLVDVISIEERPWSLPVWNCKACKYIYSGRNATMQKIALDYARASKKYIVDKVHGQVPNIKQTEEFNRRMRGEIAEDPIMELRKSIKGFKLT